jgi:succinate dehydrogenase/fumarate reductase iron-sulfur protein
MYTLRVRRWDPDGDPKPRWEQFRVPWVPTMTVIEALEWLWDQGEYVAFRANCREFTCGSCAMLINGKPALACDTPLADNVRLEPLARFAVLKDLVVDNGETKKTWQELELWPSNPELGSIREVSAQSLAGWHRSFARCIECYACLDACPASDTEQSDFKGPMWMLQIARAGAHPLDRRDRAGQASRYGMALCVNCYECQDVCPVNLSPIDEIQRLRREEVVNRIKSLFQR